MWAMNRLVWITAYVNSADTFTLTFLRPYGANGQDRANDKETGYYLLLKVILFFDR